MAAYLLKYIVSPVHAYKLSQVMQISLSEFFLDYGHTMRLSFSKDFKN